MSYSSYDIDFYPPKTLKWVPIGRCDFCDRENLNHSGLLGLFEGNTHFGWQYCKECQPHLVRIIVDLKREYANNPIDETRRPVYLTLKDKRVGSPDGQIRNSPHEFNISLIGYEGEEQFRVNTSFTRISKSFGEIIWRSSCGFDVPLSSLIKKNREFFGDSISDFPLNIDMDIHKPEDIGFWKKMINTSYEKAGDDQ